jgi:uncharacterized protein YqgV (UPF0045/DUF77 family)
MRYEVEPFGTVVEGGLEQILAAIRSIHSRLSAEEIERFDLQVRIRQEPGEASIERETAGFRERTAGKPEGMPGLKA